MLSFAIVLAYFHGTSSSQQDGSRGNHTSNIPDVTVRIWKMEAAKIRETAATTLTYSFTLIYVHIYCMCNYSLIFKYI